MRPRVILYLLISPSYYETFSNIKKISWQIFAPLVSRHPNRSEQPKWEWIILSYQCTRPMYRLVVGALHCFYIVWLKSAHVHINFMYNFITVKAIIVALTLLAKPLPRVQILWNIAPRYTDLLQGELNKITSTLNLPILRDVSSYHNGRLRSMTGRVTVGVQLWAWPWGTWLWQRVKWLGSFIQISTMYDSSLKRTIELCHILNGNFCKISHAIVKFDAFKQ